ncbi:glyceraldehyde 3-phosphate dehydrogenase NAD-binding domain-containing protein [Chryseobacterium scophthalmum]|uniref:glyceraldehyde 3-phosphate dehydrogenase NAD-binding domain-containing protein n=1 Tax=Chryseobacterium scophthalmum TaxID=59733 RepID=UPI003D7C34BD
MKIAINGFGRIGRMTLRALQNHPEVDVVAINDLTDVKTLAHLLKYDTAHGLFPSEISIEDNAIVVNGKKIIITNEKNPVSLP